MPWTFLCSEGKEVMPMGNSQGIVIASEAWQSQGEDESPGPGYNIVKGQPEVNQA